MCWGEGNKGVVIQGEVLVHVGNEWLGEGTGAGVKVQWRRLVRGAHEDVIDTGTFMWEAKSVTVDRIVVRLDNKVDLFCGNKSSGSSN